MAVSQFPPVSGSSQEDVVFLEATSANTLYSKEISLEPGTYTISCPDATVTKISFWSGSTALGTATTSSGTIDFVISETTDKCTFWTDTGSSVQIRIEKSGLSLGVGVSGTLDTITVSGSYTQTGYGAVLLVGGGTAGTGNGGVGGRSGNVYYKDNVYFPGNVSVFIGSGGINPGGAGGHTTFGSFSSSVGSFSGTAPRGADGTATGPGLPVVDGTTGSGGGAGNPGSWGRSGAGSFGPGNSYIGKGGGGGATGPVVTSQGWFVGPQDGSPGSGYGAGGGGGGAAGPGSYSQGTPSSFQPAKLGGDGSPGVVYIIRHTE